MELKPNKQAFLIYSAEADVALTLNNFWRKEFILNYSTQEIHCARIQNVTFKRQENMISLEEVALEG